MKHTRKHQPAQVDHKLQPPPNHAVKAEGLVAKDHILELLSDEEVSRVATAETKASLTDGEQYLDLDHLDRGVLTARGTAAPIGRVLPRRAIREQTWREIEAHLATRAEPNKV